MLNKLRTRIGLLLMLACMTPSFMLTGCGEMPLGDDGEIADDTLPPENIETTDQVISLEDALQIAESVGVNSAHLIYSEVLPLAISDDEAMLTWGFVEKLDADDFRVTHIDRWTGEVLEIGATAPENIRDFLLKTGIADIAVPLAPSTGGSGPNSYNSFPWGFQVPSSTSSAAHLTRGYGVATHTGLDYYATDWDPGSEGFNLEAPASCWAIYRGKSSSYGNQFIGECGDAGGGKRYYIRAAHFKEESELVPGWWIDKGREYMGRMGHTGNASGDHVHFVVYRATSSSGGNFTNGESLPINRWPGSGDSICDRKFAGYSFSGEPRLTFNIGSNGCP